VKAAFSLAKLGDLSANPLKCKEVSASVMLAGQKPGISHSLKEAEPTIRKRLCALHVRRRCGTLSHASRRTTPEIHPELTEAIQLEASPRSRPDAGFPSALVRARRRPRTE